MISATAFEWTIICAPPSSADETAKATGITYCALRSRAPAAAARA